MSKYSGKLYKAFVRTKDGLCSPFETAWGLNLPVITYKVGEWKHSNTGIYCANNLKTAIKWAAQAKKCPYNAHKAIDIYEVEGNRCWDIYNNGLREKEAKTPGVLDKDEKLRYDETIAKEIKIIRWIQVI
jgi:hypothetical protein